MTNILAVIQARMTSSRLPGKVLMDIAGAPALQHMIERVRRARSIDNIVVATTANATDDPIVELAHRLGVAIFRGEEMDVLGRFVGAVARQPESILLRLTADCPMIDPDVVEDMIGMFRSGSYDYVSNGNVRTFPDGLDAEVFTAAALREADAKARHPFLREHVTPYIRGSHPQYGAGKFRIGQLLAPADFSLVRWTLDTPEDLARIRRLVAALPPRYTWMQALAVAIRETELLGIASSARLPVDRDSMPRLATR